MSSSPEVNPNAGCDSPWGPLRVADAHLHFFSHTFFQGLVAQGSGLTPPLTMDGARQRLGWEMPPEDPKSLAATWVDEFARNGVSVGGLIASLPTDLDSVIAAARAFPHRFLPYAMVNPRAIEAAIWPPPEFEEVRVVCLFPAMHRFGIADDCVQLVLEWAAQQPHRAVFVHCGVLSVGVRNKLGLPSPFDMRYSNPIDIHSVALRYPKVPFIVPHFGAGYFREALMLADQCHNVYLDTSSSNSWVKYHFGDLSLREVFRHALSVVGPHRLLFGSDSSFFPRGWNREVFEDQAKALYEIGTSATDARLVFGENLVRILGI